MSATEVILLERVDNLGAMGDVVKVKPGFARNYLLPQKKALRATEDNIAYFNAKKADLEKVNKERRTEAEKRSDKLKDLTLVIIRQASEKGQLYGSVTSRDIAEVLGEKVMKVERGQVSLNDAIKTIGLFEVEIVLHPEVRETIQINIARNEDEADVQKRTGVAIIAEEGETTDEIRARAEKQFEELLEDSAKEAEKEKVAKEEEEAEEAARKEEERAAKKAEKDAAKAAAEAEAAEAEEAGEAAPEAEASEEASEEAKEDDK